MLTSSLAIHLLCLVAGGQNAAIPATPEAKAVAFLSREVPRWSREKHCFSCHNNGDGARALFRAARQGEHVPAQSGGLLGAGCLSCHRQILLIAQPVSYNYQRPGQGVKR